MPKAPTARAAPKTINGMALWPIADLVPYANNARTHSPEQVADLARAIDAFGLAGVIVVRGGTIAKGHGTLAACRQIIDGGGLVYPVPGAAGGATAYPRGYLPVQDATGWTDAAFRAFVIADNKLAERSGWDRDLLAVELDAIARFDADLVGFTGFDLSDLEAEIAAALGPAKPAPGAAAAPDLDEGDPDPDSQDPAAGPGTRPDRPLVYQIIVDMDQPTKRLYLKHKRRYPSAAAFFRAAIERMEFTDEADPQDHA